MAEASIPVDLFNPGQVFACLGFLEAADVLLGDAEGCFDWNNEADVRFMMSANGDANPFAHVLAFLEAAEVESIAPFGSGLSSSKWNVPTRLMEASEPYPFPEPSSPATLPAVLRHAPFPASPTIVIDHWGDVTRRDNVKFWAGAGGYPGAALLRDGLGIADAMLSASFADPFAVSAPQTSSFRLDWRRDYIPLDVGFSPNTHGDIRMMGFPIVELMAVIGLSHARPRRFNKLSYGYAVLGPTRAASLLPPSFHRAALGQSKLPFPSRAFGFLMGWPGQENQARCILDVTEEIIA